MEMHPVIRDIQEMSEYSVHQKIQSQDYEMVRKFKVEAEKKAKELLDSGKNLYDLEYFLEYEFMPHWQKIN